jgi:hypothetical protein
MPKPGVMYVPSHVNLGTHPKTRKLARRLDVDVVTAVGHLHFLWWWGMSFAPDGDLGQFTAEDLAIAGEWPGDCDQFVHALEDSGFITDGAFHDWDQYGGQLFTVRERNREKQQRHRDTQSGNRDVTVTSPHGNRHPLRRGEERREEKSNTPNGVMRAKPQPAYSPEFEAFWSEYPRGHGIKHKAFEFWKRINAADYADVIAGLRAWKASERWQEGYVKDAERWLRDAVWRETPPEPKHRASPRSNGKPDMFEIARRLREQEQQSA